MHVFHIIIIITKVIHDDIEHSNPEKIYNLFNFSNAAERVLELAGITESDEYVLH